MIANMKIFIRFAALAVALLCGTFAFSEVESKSSASPEGNGNSNPPASVSPSKRSRTSDNSSPSDSHLPSGDSPIRTTKDPVSKDPLSASVASRPDKSGQGGAASDYADAELSPSLYISVQDQAMDWWFRLPPDSVPHISQIKKIFFNQNFALFPFVSGAAVKDGKFSLTYSIDCKYPDGSVKSIVKDSNFDGEKSSPNIIVACPDVIAASFDESFKDGKYIFTFTVKDNVSGRTAKYVNDMDLVAWSAPNPFVGAKIVRDYVKFFYLQPSPEALWSIFFSKDFNLEQKKAPNSLNYSHIGFLKAAFKRNGFLLSAARDYFKKASSMDRAKIIFLLAICGEDPIDESILKEKEKAYQKRIRAAKFPDPYKEWDSVMGAAQVDMLWGEFYSDGTYKPIRRIMDLLSRNEEAVFSDNLKAARKRPENQEEWKKFMLGLLNRAALMTIAQHCYEMPLVEQYCVWALKNNDVPSSSKQVLVPIVEPEGANKK